MVWEPGEEAWENQLAAFRSYRRATGHLSPRQDAMWGESEAGGLMPIGQHMANLRQKGGLCKAPYRAEKRAAQLAAIDEDWNCPWPLNWQRRYRFLADLVDADGPLPHIAPGVTFDGDDIGSWRWQQQNSGVRAQLTPEQRERLAALGILVVEPAPPVPAAPHTAKKGWAGHRRRSSGASRPSPSGRSRKATGRCPGVRSLKSPSTARTSRCREAERVDLEHHREGTGWTPTSSPLSRNWAWIGRWADAQRQASSLGSRKTGVPHPCSVFLGVRRSQSRPIAEARER
jgi:hypothetical protein